MASAIIVNLSIMLLALLSLSAVSLSVLMILGICRFLKISFISAMSSEIVCVKLVVGAAGFTGLLFSHAFRVRLLCWLSWFVCCLCCCVYFHVCFD